MVVERTQNRRYGTVIKQLSPGVRESIAAHALASDICQCLVGIIENSIDAGATIIECDLDLSRLSFQVADNGSGMDPADLEVAGLPGYTARYEGRSFGYRGETLHAIGVCATVEVVSRAEDETWAMKIHRGSRLGVYRDVAEAVAFGKGTTVRVSNLFANLPVRRKQALLESRATVMQRLKRLLAVPLALCPHVTLSVCSGGQRAVHVPVHRRDDVPRMVQALEMLHGKGVVAEWVNVQYEREGGRVSGVFGVWGGPAAARPREIVLRRRDRFDDAITHRQAQQSVGDDARFYMLFVDTRETRASSVRQLVLGALSSSSAAATQDGASSTASPRRPKHGLRMSPKACGRKPGIPRLHPALGVSGHFGNDDVLTRKDLQASRAVAQFNGEFVLVRIDRADGAPVLAVLDPHAADERIRYEEQLARLCSETAIEPVPLRAPVELAVTETDTAALDTYRPALERWGARFGTTNTRLVVRGLPLVLATRPDLASAAAGLVRHARDLRDSADAHATPSDAAVPSVIRAAVGTAACHSAIRFGDRITPQEAQSLVARLSRCSQPFSCIHGRPSVVPLYTLASNQ